MKVGEAESVEGTATSVYTVESKGPGAVDRIVKTVQIVGVGDIVLAEDIEQGH